MSGTEELTTERLLLRRYRMDDAEILHKNFGADPEMYRYSGWNPYETEEMALATVRNFIDSYKDPHFYGWAIVREKRLVGTIGAYDYDAVLNRIEAGMSIERASWGKGYAGEALSCVLHYLTEHEHIETVTAWCASDNIGSEKAMKKAGMVCTGTGTMILNGTDRECGKLIFSFRKEN